MPLSRNPVSDYACEYCGGRPYETMRGLYMRDPVKLVKVEHVSDCYMLVRKRIWSNRIFRLSRTA